MINFLLVGDDFPAAQTLQGLLNDDRARVVAIYSSGHRGFDPRLRAIAAKSGIPLFNSDRLKTEAGLDECAQFAFDWIINVNSTVILPPDILALARAAAINMHPGRLPDYAGLHTHQWALRNGENTFAATVHYMKEGVDTGDIIHQREFEISPTDSGLTLYHKCMREGIRTLSHVLSLILDGQKISGIPQDLSRYRLFRHSDALDGRIDWTWSAAQVERFIRAGNYAPLTSPTYTAVLDEVPRNGDIARPQVLSAKIVDLQDEDLQPGMVVHLSPDPALGVVCGDGRGLRLNQVRWMSDLQALTPERLRGLLPHGTYLKGRSA